MNFERMIKSLILKKNRKNYLYCILLISLYIVIMTTFSFLISNLINTNHFITFPYAKVTYRSFRMVIYCGGAIFILNQYVSVIQMNREEFNALCEIGATKDEIDFLILILSVCLIVFTVPLGIGLGMLSVHAVQTVLQEVFGMIIDFDYPSIPLYLSLFALILTMIFTNLYLRIDKNSSSAKKNLFQILIIKIVSML
ncbi:MAG: FtsX-like permease family protein [Lachnospiraceae bacterium]|nr:FtsX-like permease family protein [Lachnospiraceae bacterium]